MDQSLRDAEAQAEYDDQWPDHCRFCDGWGGHVSTYDPSPAGVSLGSGFLYEYDPCGWCVDNGICPRCGKVSTSIQIAIEKGNDIRCEKCGWVEGEDDGRPPDPECNCLDAESMNEFGHCWSEYWDFVEEGFDY